MNADSLIGTEVTLNGERAIVRASSDDRARFVNIATIPDGPSYDWANDAAQRIIADGGRFRS